MCVVHELARNKAVQGRVNGARPRVQVERGVVIGGDHVGKLRITAIWRHPISPQDRDRRRIDGRRYIGMPARPWM